MANPEHVAILKQGVEAWNAWRREANPTIEPDLSEAKLSEAKLSGADLSRAYLVRANLIGADLRGAILRDADLSGAILSGAILSEANLRDADLNGAILRGANLREANLSGATLGWANLIEADLLGADFSRALLGWTDLSGARFGWVRFGNVDLQDVIGLEAVNHEGPSTIGIDSVYQSNGKIPEMFLRGCGVNPLIQGILLGTRESMTTAFYEFVNEARGPLRLQSCFISYGTHDKPFVDRLQKSLNASGVNYWYAPEHGRWGQELTSQIDREIEQRDRVILVCSEHSLSSDWVRWEIDRTRAQEKERGKTILYPVMLDDTVLKWNDPRASRIRELLVGDFRGATKGKAFEARFRRLMEGLRDEG